MRIKLFQAANMADAMAQIRAELGADAIILEQRRTRYGVEVTAALEPDEPLLIQPITPPAPLVTAGPLDFHNIAPGLAQALATAPLAESLATALGFAPLPDGREHPLLLAGPPGAGKTVTIAKLAARHQAGLAINAAPRVQQRRAPNRQIRRHQARLVIPRPYPPPPA